MPDPERLRREDSFFGLHFDLHPGKNDTELGRDLTEDMVRNLLDEVNPDYVQYDCKGHPGYAGYPTKVGWPSPGIVKDSLAIWRKVTSERGIGLYIHYSGVWDSLAVEKHPEWARKDADGKPDQRITSTFGPYCEELLIPQLKEVIDAYDLDGVWVDGECWAIQPDYRPSALAVFREETGIEKIPLKPGDDHWPIFMEFQRRAFREYVCKYADALHAHKPSFQITSNWMYTSLAPEPITLPLDFLSGDYSPTDSVNTARFEARYLASTDMPWDLMAWGFNKGRNCGSSAKTATQLKQEASVVLSQGGGFQIYYNPTRAGWVDQWMIRIMADVARFCRARQPFSHKTESVPQVALLLSETSIYDRADRPYGPWGELMAPYHGMLHALLELHYSVDVLAEHKLIDRLPQYPLVIIPECHKLPEDFKAALIAHTKEGGSLLLVGAETVQMFREYLGVDFKGDPKETQIFVEGGAALAWMGGLWQMVEAKNSETIITGYASSDTREGGICAASVKGLGNGRIAAIYGPFGSVYRRSHNSVARRLLRDLIRLMFPLPLVDVEALPCVDVSLRRKETDLLIHLTNTANMQSSPEYTTIDHIPPVGPIMIEMRVDRAPEELSLGPCHMPVVWDWGGGRLKVLLESLSIHQVLAIRGILN